MYAQESGGVRYYEYGELDSHLNTLNCTSHMVHT
jgi:hypothetical protein